MDSYGETEDGKLFYKKNKEQIVIFETHAYGYGPLTRLSFAYDRFRQDHTQKTIFLQLLQEYVTIHMQSPLLSSLTTQNNQSAQIMTKRKHNQMVNLYLRYRNNQHQRHIE